MYRRWRLYLDTSVFGGVFDLTEGYDESSRRVFSAALDGRALICYSAAVLRELVDAPEPVRALFEALPIGSRVEIPLTDEVVALSEAYLIAGVVGRQWLDDALHVAAATVARADAIVSWNFKHIVRLDKIKAYNQVNLAQGYGILTIVSPKEVLFDE